MLQTPSERMLKHCPSIHAEHDARALLKQCSTYVTYERTHVHLLLTFRRNLTLSNARENHRAATLRAAR